jgi:hypothetical protein
VLVDRRLDPDTAIRLECRDEPLVDVLGRGAAAADGELAALASSIWIVPRGRADVTLRAEAARTATIAALPPRQRSLLLGKQPWQWPAGARPRDLVAACAAAEQIRLEAIDSVPHDHLPAVSLPAMTLAERLDLILAPYDLRVDWQSTSSTARGRADAAITGRLIAIDRGLPPVAATAARSTNSKPPGRRVSAKPQPAAAEQTFSLRVAAPLEEVLAAIAMRLGVAVALDRESLTQAGISPQEIVRATITNASRDDLLDAILAPLKLRWKIDGTTLRVFASSDRP